MTLWRAKTVDPIEVRISRYFRDTKIVCSMAPEFDGTSIIIEKSNIKDAVPSNSARNLMHFQSDYGVFSLFNADQLLRALIGINVQFLPGVAGDDQVALLCKSLPGAMTRLFGQIYSYTGELECGDKYRATLKAESEDLGLVAGIEATYTFWQAMTDGIDPELEVSVLPESSSHTTSSYHLPIRVGTTELNCGALDDLEIGDVVLLDRCFINQAGYGTISVDELNFEYELIRCSNKVCMKVIEIF